MHDVRQHRSIHLLVFVPVRAVQVRNIKIVALIAPTFVEDLFEFFFGIEIHAQRKVNAPATRLWRSPICVNDKERRVRSATTKASTTTATTAASGAIDQLASISADFESSHAVNERCRASIAKPITNQFISGAATASSTATGALRARGFQVINDSIGAGS